MKNTFILLALLASLSIAAFAQDRLPPTRRTFQPSPHLMAVADTDDAAGLAQTPFGYVIPLQGDPVPAQSTVGIFGRHLLGSGASKVLLWSDSDILVLEAQVARNPFPGLEMITFHLPASVHGEVWVTVAGRRASNTVRIIVE